MTKYERAEEFDVEARVMIPAAMYKSLVKIAAVNKVTIGALVTECVRRTLMEPDLGPVQHTARGAKLRALVTLHRRGLNDRQIAAELHTRTEWVQKNRVALDLPRNDPRGGHTKSPVPPSLLVVGRTQK